MALRRTKAAILGTRHAASPATSRRIARQGPYDEVRRLARELKTAREQLRKSVQLSASNLELQSANEENVAMNLELQETNEELEFSNEHLLTANIQLNSLNLQLRAKIHELEIANSDIANLFDSTQIPSVFLDGGLRLRRFTPTAANLFKFIGTDVGRPISDVATLFADGDLLAEARRAMDEQTTREREIRTKDGRWFLRRVVPYRTLDNSIDGIVMTFVDITERKQAAINERKQAEAALTESRERLASIFNTVADAIITIDQHGVIQSINPAAERMFGYGPGELIGKDVKVLMPPPYRDEHDGYISRYVRTGEKHVIGTSRETVAQRKDGSIFPVELAISEIGHLKLFTGVHHDLTQRKQLQREVVEAATSEQRRIGQDLHDSVAQELTALELLVGDLSEAIKSDPQGCTKLVHLIADGLRRSKREIRSVMRGLVPVSVDSQGLMAALSDLADRVQQQGKAACTFHCRQSVAVGDNLIATHLYLIAQEAAYNAAKHAQAANIRIELEQNKGELVLRIADDGKGMPPHLLESHGLGLHIMRNRAAIIGANLTIEEAAPTGTIVTCALRNHAITSATP